MVPGRLFPWERARPCQFRHLWNQVPAAADAWDCPMNKPAKPIVLITGAAGNIGRSLADALSDGYAIVGLDREGTKADFPLIAVDLTDGDSVNRALETFRREHGS